MNAKEAKELSERTKTVITENLVEEILAKVEAQATRGYNVFCTKVSFLNKDEELLEKLLQAQGYEVKIITSVSLEDSPILKAQNFSTDGDNKPILMVTW